MELSVSHINLTLGSGRKTMRPVLRDVSFTVPDGAFCSLLGESGAGKSTLLKVIAGILLQDSGSIAFDGAAVDGLPPHRRRLGFVFQDVRLFPHMTVEENVAYPLRMAGVGRRERRARAQELIERVQLAGFGPRPVQTLSGGQAQRVALARAIAAAPAALLLDEPFSGLDESLRDDMRSLLLRLHREEGVTALMVTHDATSASYCERIMFIKDGRLSGELRRGAADRAAFYRGIADAVSGMGGGDGGCLLGLPWATSANRSRISGSTSSPSCWAWRCSTRSTRCRSSAPCSR